MENNINKFSGKKQKELILEHVFSGHQFFLKSNYNYHIFTKNSYIYFNIDEHNTVHTFRWEPEQITYFFL